MSQNTIQVQDFSTYLFWDVNISNLSLDQHASYIIDRVMSLGTIHDFRLLIAYYGKQKIGEVLQDMRYLDEKVLYFCSLYFNIPLSDFRCFIQKPLTSSHWQY